MIQGEQLNMAAACNQVQQGSDIVVVPYSSYMQRNGDVRLGIYTHMAAEAAACLYRQAGTAETAIVAVGEHTYGDTVPSTTELIYQHLAAVGISKAVFAAKHPHRANATPQQIRWLQRTFGEQWRGRPPVLIGQQPHWPRIRYLCELYGLPANFADAGTVLAACGALTPEYYEAIRLYRTQNQHYEDQAKRITRSIAWLGPVAITVVFQALTQLRSPNVLDVSTTPHGVQLYAMPVRRHKRLLRKQGAQIS